MKKYLFIIFISTGSSLFAQQTVQYAQYTLNNYGLNPAAAGTSKKYEILFGRRSQWLGFDYAPITNFAYISKSLGKLNHRNYWHGLGLYVEQDKAGQFTSKHIYSTYAFHLVIARNYKLAFGVSAGYKRYASGSSFYSTNDPALLLYPPVLSVYPDISAGMKLYSKKLFLDVAVKQLYKNKIQEGSKMIGTPSLLRPHVYVTFGKRFNSRSYEYSFEPSVHLKSTFTAPPSVTAGCMMYINKRVGLGLFGRFPDCIYGVIQLRVFKNCIIGFAYDYTLSPFKTASANSMEIMAGISPLMSVETLPTSYSTSSCPVFDY